MRGGGRRLLLSGFVNPRRGFPRGSRAPKARLEGSGGDGKRRRVPRGRSTMSAHPRERPFHPRIACSIYLFASSFARLARIHARPEYMHAHLPATRSPSSSLFLSLSLHFDAGTMAHLLLRWHRTWPVKLRLSATFGGESASRSGRNGTKMNPLSSSRNVKTQRRRLFISFGLSHVIDPAINFVGSNR